MHRLKGIGPTEQWLILVIALISIFLALTTDTFLTLVNLFDLLNYSAVNIMFAAGLLVVLIAGGIDISFAVAASVVQYLTVTILMQMGGGNWAAGLVLACFVGVCLGSLNAALIYHFRITSIVVTIATFNLFFGMLMYVTGGVSIYDLPDWLSYARRPLRARDRNRLCRNHPAGPGDGRRGDADLAAPASPQHRASALCHG